MKEMTKTFLQEAFAGESQAHMRYLAFADAAEREGLPNVARFFKAASYSEQKHATAHLRALGGIGTAGVPAVVITPCQVPLSTAGRFSSWTRARW